MKKIDIESIILIAEFHNKAVSFYKENDNLTERLKHLRRFGMSLNDAMKLHDHIKQTTAEK